MDGGGENASSALLRIEVPIGAGRCGGRPGAIKLLVDDWGLDLLFFPLGIVLPLLSMSANAISTFDIPQRPSSTLELALLPFCLLPNATCSGSISCRPDLSCRLPTEELRSRELFRDCDIPDDADELVLAAIC